MYLLAECDLHELAVEGLSAEAHPGALVLVVIQCREYSAVHKLVVVNLDRTQSLRPFINSFVKAATLGPVQDHEGRS